MKRDSKLFFCVGTFILLLVSYGTLTAETNIASIRNGDYWFRMKSPSVTTNQIATPLIDNSDGSIIPNFTIDVTSSSQSVLEGSCANYIVSVSPQNGFIGTVNLSVSGLPDSVNLYIPSSIKDGSGSSLLQVWTDSSTTGTYTLSVTGTSGALTQTASTSLTVFPIRGNGTFSDWMGYTWNIDPNGTPIGGGLITSNSNNLWIDSNDYLHIEINESGGTWTGAEMFTQDNLGFGTYQWVLQGTNFYQMDPSIVLGLFSYGPAKGIGFDGTNEIDIEFSQWGTTGDTQNIDFTVYPATGCGLPGGPPSSDQTYWITPPTSSTATTTVRFVWSSTRVSWYAMSGTVDINTPATNVLQGYTYNGSTTTIPQTALPIGINFWTFETLPTNPWDVIIESFSYLPE